MYLVEIFLPLADNNGRRFAPEEFKRVRDTLIERFGGVTAFSRAPAKGVTTEGGEAVADDIAIYEVMADELDAAWWSSYRRSLEHTFRQDEILIRASEITRL